MDRWNFLKTCTMVAAGSVLTQGSAVAETLTYQPVAAKARYRGTSDGKIMVTENEGASWTVHADFGNQFGVLNSLASGQDTVALVQYRGLQFKLKLSADGKHWVTM